MNNMDRGYVTVDLDAVIDNLSAMKSNINNNSQILAVIKTDGYGHGAIPIARELENIDYIWGYAVATAEEAGAIRNNGCDKPILILGYTFPYSYEYIINKGIRPAVFKTDMLKALDECAKKNNIIAPIHIKVDTGMSRIGITPDEKGLEFVKLALECKNLKIEGVFTHMARADEIDKVYANKQISTFADFCKQIEEKLEYKIPIKHCSNSAGIIELNNANMDMVRAGITLYGLWPSNEVDKSIIELKPVLSWISHVVYIKEVEPGTQISYGGTFVADKKLRIATIPIGYGDGYPRGLSNKGYVLIRGHKCNITGRVCMDQFMVDVTEYDDISEGDTVTLIGADEDNLITMEELGDISGRFNYELACDIGVRMPRVYLKNGNISEICSSYSLI